MHAVSLSDFTLTYAVVMRFNVKDAEFGPTSQGINLGPVQ